jgi:GAF domain-containing protein
MRRRNKTGGKEGKTQRPKTLKRHNAPKTARRRNFSAAGPQEQISALTRELKEALEQQTATSEVLKVISSSPAQLEPVFQAILANAVRICEAKFGMVFLYENSEFQSVALLNASKDLAEFFWRRGPFKAPPGTPLDRLLKTKDVIYTADEAAEPNPGASARLGGARSLVGVPMVKQNKLIGAIVIYRQEVRPFTDKQIELVANFAKQAVIAIENARLLNELRESLQQQTATSEVLKIISSSPGELEPVFSKMLENAARICEAKFGTLVLEEGGGRFRVVAMHGAPSEWAEKRTREPVFTPGPLNNVAIVARTKKVRHVPDLRLDRSYLEQDQAAMALADIAGARTLIVVPLIKNDEVIGMFGIYRQEVRPFTEKQIELVQNFAAQAVIAIENTRLLTEIRQRSVDLSESLEQQTATSEVLKVISSSPGELEPVFNAMLANATRICEAKFGIIFQFDGERFRCMAEVGSPPVFAEFLKQQGSFQPLKGSHLDRIMRTKHVSHTADYAAEGIPSPPVKFGGARSTVDVPMLKDNELIGAFSIYRQEVRPFTDKQIALLTNFAAQAVIAIENARLLTDLNKLNQQLEQRVTDQVSEIERMGRLRRFLPPQVADLIVASGTEKQLESHRREITALFCDLRGFTGFSESSDPEDVMALLREYHAAIGGIINKYGGTLERYAGDGVMVIFNDPIPVDNPALQAVLMAIDMRAALGELIEKWRKLGHDIGFGIGIAHGFATLGTIGFEGRFDYAAIGTVSNVASRLCDEAKPGQVLISPRVLMAVEKDITVEPVGDFVLKGIRRPLTAYNVLATKAAN